MFLCSLIQCAHVLYHLKTVKRFHNRISINYRQVKDRSMGWDFFKCPGKIWILSQKFRWKMFFSSNFFWSPLQCKHVLNHPENVESFHSCILSGKRHLRVSTCDSSFSKTSSNCEILVQNFDAKCCLNNVSFYVPWHLKHILRHTEDMKILWILLSNGERYLKGIS